MPRFHRIKSLATTTTARLAASYLAIIMLMSIGFSIVLYNVSARELRPRGPRPETSQSDGSAPLPGGRPFFERNPEVETFLREREAEGKHAILERLIILNLIALAAGSALSYYLARRTLEPIEENMDAQAQFVSDASHELRTPLTALQTTNEVALRKTKLTEAEARDLLSHNVAEVAKLQALTTALLKLAKSDGSDITHVPVSLQQASSEAMNTIISAAQAKEITIDDNVPDIKVLGDHTALAQCIAILLDNAVKYSPNGSQIRLSGGHGTRTGFVRVLDHGAGIAAKDLPHIFNRFYRADQSRTRSNKTTGKAAERDGQADSPQPDGYGIGLSLAKKLAHQMDGEILASSTEGKGSTFTICLPLA